MECGGGGELDELSVLHLNIIENENLYFMIKILFLSTLWISSLQLQGQTPVDVAESTIKVGILGEEIFYFGFAEGDKLIFNFEEVNGKELKELEILEMPSTSKMLEVKTSKIANKIIKIPRTGIYRFRFTSSAISVRLCKYKIQRIPASAATQNFNPTVFNDFVNDTTYTTEQEDYLAKTDTVFINYQDRIVKINPASNPAGNKSTFNFVLPDNVIAWSYYLYTNPAGQQAYESANKQILATEKSAVAKFPLYNALAAIALNRTVSFSKIEVGETINYWIMEGENAGLFSSGAQFRYIKKGKVINDYSRMEPRKGSLYFCFSNDHTTQPASITVKITLVQVNEVLQTRQIKKMQVTSKSKMFLKN
ncbi:MAG: hypothetical protein IPO53_02790 [Chitinophagaceae bacterium]|nr:hypothetical protein [Chitinophagaceae bacterium]